LAHPASSVVPVREVLERRWPLATQPVGSGAFRLKSFAKRLRWEAVDPALPIKAIEVNQSPDSSRDWDDLLSGRLDAVELPESRRDTLVGVDGELAAAWAGRGFGLYKVLRSDVLMIGFSRKTPLLAEKRGLRLALGQAIQPGDLSRQAYGGRAITANGPLPPGVEGYHLDYRHSYRGGDLAKAKDLLGSNGFGYGKGLPEYRLGCLNHAVERKICALLIQSWSRIGIRAREVVLSTPDRRAAILEGTIDLWPVTWVADLPGPASFLEVFAIGDLPEVPGIFRGRDQFLELLRHVRESSGGAARQKWVDRAQDFLNIDSPAAFLLHRYQYWLLRDGVQGVGIEDFSWQDSDQVSISRAAGS